MRVYLGSGSWARRKILEDTLGYEVILCPSHVSEELEEGALPASTEELVKAICQKKTAAVLAMLKPPYETNILVCGDLLGYCPDENTELGKPKDLQETKSWYKELYEKHKMFGVIQAVQICDLSTGKQAIGVARAEVFLKDDVEFKDPELESYILASGALKAAGGIIVEHPYIETKVKGIHGDLDTIQGLSSRLFTELLQQLTAD